MTLREADMTLTQTMFGLRGRLNRAAYIGYGLLSFAGVFVASGILIGIGVSGGGAPGPILIACALGLPGFAAAVWVGIALGVKRLHDMDMSGAHLIWIYLVPAVAGAVSEAVGVSFVGTLVGLGITLWLWCTPGTNGANRFGEPRVLIPGMAQAAAT
jgi:uncharacterized membrane protein YhaH (DUF805 family)